MRKINFLTTTESIKSFKQVEETRRSLFKAQESDLSPISFKEVFGDFSDCVFYGELDLSGLNLNSLEGCPCEVRHGDFHIDSNPSLESLEFFPKKLPSGEALIIDLKHLALLATIDPVSYKDINYLTVNANGQLVGSTDKKHIEIVVAMENFVKVRGIEAFKTFVLANFLKTKQNKGLQPINPKKLEKFYLIYEKVGFDQEKLKRAIELI